MFTVMKQKEFNLQFMREANQTLEIQQLHINNNSPIQGSFTRTQVGIFNGGNQGGKSNYVKTEGSKEHST